MATATSMFTTITATEWAPQDRLDALRNTLFVPKRLVNLVDARHNKGDVHWSTSFTQADGVHFSAFRGAPLQTVRPRHTNPSMQDAVILTWVRNGSVVQEHPDGTQVLVKQNQLHVYDTTQPMRFHWSAVRDAFLVLPRHRVVETLQGHAPPTGAMPDEVATLAPFLRAQLDLLECHGPKLQQAPLASALDAAAQLALACMRELIRCAPHAPDDSLAHGLLTAANQYMQQHLNNPRLNAQIIAQAAGCSRTRLYETHAAHGKTVMGALRELRLQHARKLLEQAGPLNVEALAWRCGFADRSSFSRLFKTHFGVAPSEWAASNRRATGLKGYSKP